MAAQPKMRKSKQNQKNWVKKPNDNNNQQQQQHQITDQELIQDTDETWNDTNDDGHFHPLSIDPPQLIINNNNNNNNNNLNNTNHPQSKPTHSIESTSNLTTISPHSNLNPPIQSTSSASTQSHPTIHPSVSKNVFDLIKDPAYVLTRLKTEQDPSHSPIQSAPSTNSPSNHPVAALPWETILPTQLINKQPSSPSPHQSPPSSSPTEPPTAPYQLLPSETEERKNNNLQEIRKERKFIECLENTTIDVTELRKLSWSGIPFKLRSFVWQVLLGYLPAPQSRRIEILARKRQEYLDAVRLAFGNQNQRLDQAIWHQIQIDVARTNPGVPLWQFPATRRSLERILYVWAIRHPASGYVQGINDLVTPFFQVFLTSYIDNSLIEVERYDASNLPVEALDAIEADSFWSLSKLLEGIQDNYIFAQPGIQRQVARLKELCGRVDARLYRHLENEKVEFIQFAFRWINCLLMRELSTKKIIRMWDSYLAEGTAAFSEFHLYVCLAFLVKYSDQLRAMDFQSIIIFLQALPTQDLKEKDLEFLLSQAFMWHSLFQGATGHFVRK